MNEKANGKESFICEDNCRYIYLIKNKLANRIKAIIKKGLIMAKNV